MATLVIGIDDGRQWVAPRTDADIVELGKQYVAYEASLPPAQQLPLPSVTAINVALTEAMTGLEAARQEENRRAVAATEVHRAMDQATPLLNEAFEQLKWRHRENLSQLRDYRLITRTGANGKVLVTRPRNEQAWADFLLAFVPLEEALPAEQRILAGNLLPLKGLSVTVRDNQVARREAKTARKQAVETRSETAGPLLDLLQLAFGALVITRFERRVTAALESWGFRISAIPGKTPEPPAEPGAPAEPTA